MANAQQVFSQGSLIFNPSAQNQQKPGPWGRPTHRTPGGTREGCLGQLVALVPGDQPLPLAIDGCWLASSSHAALTTQKQPILWFYVPQLSPAQRQAEFTLFNQQELEIDHQVVTLPGIAGVMGVKIQHPLKIGQQYGWSFSIIVYPQRPTKNPTVDGFIQRLPYPAIPQMYKIDASSESQIAWFAQQGIWHDALTMLIQQGCVTPQAPVQAKNWSSLLASVGLSVIAKTSITNCELMTADSSNIHNQLPMRTNGAQ